MKSKGNIIIGLSLVLLTGCASVSKEDTLVKFNSAMDVMDTLDSYTMNGKSKITISMGTDKQEMNIASTLEMDQNDPSNKKVYGSVIVGQEQDLAENQGEFWYKDGFTYIDIENEKSIEESDSDLVVSQTFANSLSFIQSDDDYKKVSGSNKDNDTEIKFELSDEKVKLFFEEQFGMFEEQGIEIKVIDRTMTYLIDSQDRVIKHELDFSVEISTTELTMTYKFVVDNQYSKFNETEIKYPNDLDKFLNDEKTVDEQEDVLKNKLQNVLGYMENEDDFMVLDWGTEIYQFNFAESSFSLIVKDKQYEYVWRDDIGIYNACRYNFKDGQSENCSAEEIEQLKLTKEIFEGELTQCGMILANLID